MDNQELLKSEMDKFLSLEKEIKEHKEQIKEKQKEQIKLRDNIIIVMKKENIGQMKMNGKTLSLGFVVKQKSLKKTDWIDLLSEDVGNDKAVEIVQRAFDNRIKENQEKLNVRGV